MAEPLNAPGHWDAMISYTQRNAKAELLAAEIYSSMRERDKEVWLDVKMNQLNEAAMKEAAQRSKCIIAVVTEAGCGALCQKNRLWACHTRRRDKSWCTMQACSQVQRYFY
jgi:hypothetical protein